MRELPRQLTVEQLAELFEGRTRFVELLATREDPLVHAREIASELPAADKKELLDAHPPIGGRATSARSAREQGTDDDPAVLARLAELNAAYEKRFGFRFVVFVNGRRAARSFPFSKAGCSGPVRRSSRRRSTSSCR